MLCRSLEGLERFVHASTFSSKWRKMSTNFIPTADWCDKLQDRILYLSTSNFRDFGGVKRFHGEIVTVRCLEDNSFVKKALGESGAGKVLVVDGGASMNRALLGDNMAKMAIANKWNGVIVNGCVRDSAELATLNLGIKARGTHPRKTNKLNVGIMNVEVNFGGICFRPGDFVVSDEDGVVCGEKGLFSEHLGTQ